ncbi:MAG: alpha/beta hydrolase [Anaerolineae bacterium]|jgi:pimeloyl-ACP methyl ester carboxylesterase|nr:alpha/beta hydrolase [Anaerolineae bacterium]MBT7071236.1 alpha/beta hydrolase [Anaerolineae bacterium]MBT7324181.1 alpha/beta hydrolase [Anaerolineae bacterium]
MSVVLLNEAIVHYEVLGRGRPVIFLHGWVGSWRYWISSMQVASTSFRAYALDLWGFGATAQYKQHPDFYQLSNQTELLRIFLDEMGIGKVALVGHGLGALVALGYTASYPDAVDRTMLINCPLDTKAISTRLFNDSIETLVSSFSNSLPNGETALADAKKADPAAIAASQNGIVAEDVFNKVNRQHTPCLLVSSAEDELVSLPSMEQLTLLSDLGHHIILDGAGHFPMLDSAAKFNRLLTDFLALDSGLSIKELSLKDEWRRRVR